MILTNEQKQVLDVLDNVVCDYFEVSIYDIYWGSSAKIPSTARSYIYYVAHVDLGISIRCIYKRYNRQERGVYYAISKIRYAIEHFKPYAKEYDEISDKFNEARKALGKS